MLDKMSISKVGQIAATDGHPQQEQAEAELWRRTPPPPSNVEVFYHPSDYELEAETEEYPAGWYYWYCIPGCLPDSEPFGPFESEKEAASAAIEAEEEATQ